MPHVIFTAPFFMDTTLRFIRSVGELQGVELGLITQEPRHKLPADIDHLIHGYVQLDDAMNADQIAQGVRLLQARLGPVHRLLGTLEHIQVQLGEVRDALGITGMSAEVAKNFRDKARMKDLLRNAGLPCARHRAVEQPDDAWQFAREVGFPVVLKPKEGVGAAITFRVDNDDDLRAALDVVRPAPQRQAIIEEFIVGEEHSFEVVSIRSEPVWHSLTRYSPTPLDAIRNPWIQWCVILPRDISGHEWDDVRKAGFAAVKALGIETGLTHMEWFRRRDGSVAISEIAARPPGAQIMTLNGHAHRFDLYRAWAKLMVYEVFDQPERQFAAGAAFLRGQGQGRVARVTGLDKAQKAIGHLVVEAKLPQVGQPKSSSYEGEGYAVLCHPDTAVVAHALRDLVSTVHVELEQ